MLGIQSYLICAFLHLCPLPIHKGTLLLDQRPGLPVNNQDQPGCRLLNKKEHT